MKKPNSLVCDGKQVVGTINEVMAGRQIDVYKRQTNDSLSPLRSTKSPDGIVTSSSLSTAPISMLAWCLVPLSLIHI